MPILNLQITQSHPYSFVFCVICVIFFNLVSFLLHPLRNLCYLRHISFLSIFAPLCFTFVESEPSALYLLYMHHWIKLFENQSEFENFIQLNTFVVFELRGEKICITRTPKGFYAVQDRCPHNGASLSRGMCSSNNEIVCPLHRYSFDLESGKQTSGGAFALRTYPISIKNEGVFVGIKAKWWEA